VLPSSLSDGANLTLVTFFVLSCTSAPRFSKISSVTSLLKTPVLAFGMSPESDELSKFPRSIVMLAR